MPRSAAVAGFALTVAALALTAAGCGGSSGNSVAQLGSTTTTTQGGALPTSGGAANSQMLAYARCMRSRGVSTFPDPNSSGQIPKTPVVNARKDDPARFDAANKACRHLAPNGGNGETPAEITQDWDQFRQFAQCMRRHGVSNWPDPTNRSPTDRRPMFDITAVGLDGNSPQLRAKAERCASSLHMGHGLPAAG